MKKALESTTSSCKSVMILDKILEIILMFSYRCWSGGYIARFVVHTWLKKLLRILWTVDAGNTGGTCMLDALLSSPFQSFDHCEQDHHWLLRCISVFALRCVSKCFLVKRTVVKQT